MYELYDRVLDTVTGKPCFVIDVDDHGMEGVVYGLEAEDQEDPNRFRWAEEEELKKLPGHQAGEREPADSWAEEAAEWETTWRNAVDFDYAENPDFPLVKLPEAEKRRVLAFMHKAGELFCATAGEYEDATTGKPVSGSSWGWYRVDGWQWSDRETYHLERYDLALDPAFIAHALSR